MIVGAVLAAGAGSRMGAPKAELEVDGARLIDRAVAALAGCDAVIAVVRAGTTCAAADELVVNPNPERGMRSSLVLAVDAAAGRRADSLAVLLVDTPGIAADAVATVLARWTPGRIAQAEYRGTPGHPIVMGLDDWRQALDLAGPDQGARRYLASEADRVDLVRVPGSPVDLDTPDDLHAWRA